MLSFPTLRMFEQIQESHSKHTAELANTVAQEAYDRGGRHTEETLLAGLKALSGDDSPEVRAEVLALPDEFLAEIQRLRESAVDAYKAAHPEWLARAEGVTRGLDGMRELEDKLDRLTAISTQAGVVCERWESCESRPMHLLEAYLDLSGPIQELRKRLGRPPLKTQRAWQAEHAAITATNANLRGVAEELCRAWEEELVRTPAGWPVGTPIQKAMLKLFDALGWKIGVPHV